ncbi:peptidase [Brasilonema bromeliae]|uniref:Peptidase n=1 Tax=Brasilonema bromeliae SPC951 TaxID=385972 RepID=A0ABX1P9M2_9CYAN|nr:peptidase [Brasilonema bromeliae]NMG21114.1 peptidase [Brasilonema bromeliae SPC951]
MLRSFRKYHRQIAIILCLPLFLTVLTGMAYTILNEWFHQPELAVFLIKIHSLEVLNLQGIYPLLNGLGLIGLLITGLSMTGLFGQRTNRNTLG